MNMFAQLFLTAAISLGSFFYGQHSQHIKDREIERKMISISSCTALNAPMYKYIADNKAFICAKKQKVPMCPGSLCPDLGKDGK